MIALLPFVVVAFVLSAFFCALMFIDMNWRKKHGIPVSGDAATGTDPTREWLAVVRITADCVDDPKIKYKSKAWFEIHNRSCKPIHVSRPIWSRREWHELQQQMPSVSKLMRFRESEELETIRVPSGHTFMLWIGFDLDESRNAKDRANEIMLRVATKTLGKLTLTATPADADREIDLKI